MQRPQRRPLVLAARAAVLLAMAAGSVGYSLADKSVSISVDGHTRSVHTFAGSIESALHRAGIKLGPHDTVTPDLDDSVSDGGHIVVARGRRIALDVDNQQTTAWVTQDTVGEAVLGLNLRLDGAYVSSPLTQTVPADGMALVVRLPQVVTLHTAAGTRTVTTTAPTVAELLASEGISLGAHDTVSAPMAGYPETGLKVDVVRVTRTQWLQRTKLAIPTLRVPDPHLAAGSVHLAHEGRTGMRYQWWIIVRSNGHVISKTRIKLRTLAPKAKVIRYGTKVVPVAHTVSVTTTASAPTASAPTHHTSSSSSGTSGSSSGTTHRPTTTSSPPSSPPQPKPPTTKKGSGLNWAALAQCESGGNPHMVDGPYYGLYQFSLGTWRSVGGKGLPSNASSAEQTYRAKLLYAQQGRAPWPACGHLL